MIVLASGSATRAAMLAAAGVAFEIEAANIDEAGVTAGLAAAGAPPLRVADALAELKAMKVSRRRPGMLVLGADQVLVTAEGELLDKPEGRAGAAAQLRRLMGAKHRLVSAAVVAVDGAPVWRANDSATLTMRPLSDGFIADYLAREGDAVLASVGAYRIEGLGAQLFSQVEGSHFTILGLPLLAVLDYLRVRGVLAA